MIFALDTSTLTLSAALVDEGGRAVAERSLRAESHSLLLPGVLVEMLAERGLKLRDLGGLAAGLGPGSFTGLRVGLATMKGLAFGLRLPLAGASSLAAMAQGASRAVPPGTLLCPALDARKGEVYAGLYRAGTPPEPAGPERVLPPARLAEELASAPAPRASLFGEGWNAYRALFETTGLAGAGPGVPETPPAAELGRLCLRMLGPFDREAVLALQPNYLRPSEAELNKAKRAPGSEPRR